MTSGFPSLPAETAARIGQAGKADILVGIPSFNDERTIGHVVRVVSSSLRLEFPQARAVLLMSDGGSTDRTREILEGTDVGGLTEIHLDACPSRARTGRLGSGSGGPGKGWALAGIFRAALEMKVPACAVIDGGLRSVTGRWVPMLLAPIVSGSADFVCPSYSQQKFDGMLAKLLVSPLLATLYGKRISQPLGGDFGFAGKLAETFLSCGNWEGPAAQYGVNLFATVSVLSSEARPVEAFLGAKVQGPAEPAGGLAGVLDVILSTLLGFMEQSPEAWRGVSAVTSVPRLGSPFGLGMEPDPVRLEPLAAAFRRAAADLEPIWKTYLSPQSLLAIEKAASGHVPSLGDREWVRIVFEAAAGWHRRVLRPPVLVRSLLPLYLGFVASVASDLSLATAEEAEGRFAKLSNEFENEKDLLRSLWAAG
ncbi:MAG: Glucosylglycerate synthase [Thermoanaerobaculia bacterium]|nr:Glucosylglycerate synthase [Thermoanaerobaculia bacterium]